MIQFQIPKAYFIGFETLLSLSPGEVDEIVSFLKNLPVGTGPKTFASLFNQAFLIKKWNNDSIAATLYSLGSFRISDENKMSVDEVVEGLWKSFSEQIIESGQVNIDTSSLKDHLRKFFSANQPLNITYKAFSLLSENERVFREGHIITDIRLLFNNSLEDKQRHGLIQHQLKIESEEDGDAIDYYFSLSTNDLEKLKSQIDRALEKEKWMREDYSHTISFLTITD